MNRHRFLVPAILMVAVTGVGLLGGAQATDNSVFPFWPAVYGAVVGGPNIILMLGVAVLLGGVPLVTALRQRWPAHLRARTDVRRWLDRATIGPIAAAAVIFFVAMVVWGLYVFGWKAASSPDLVDATRYGFGAEGSAELSRRFPLWTWAGDDPVVFVLASAVWASAHAALATWIAVCCALLIPSRVLALFTPVVMVIGAGIGAELTVGPVFSPIQSWMHPGGLIPSEPLLSLVPTLILAVLALAVWLGIRARAPRMARFS